MVFQHPSLCPHGSRHLLPAQLGFVQAAGCGSAQVLSNQRVQGVHGKGFLGQQDLRPRPLHNAFQHFQVPFYQSLIHHIAWGGQLGKIHLFFLPISCLVQVIFSSKLSVPCLK